jgi:hypothetical protein
MIILFQEHGHGGTCDEVAFLALFAICRPLFRLLVIVFADITASMDPPSESRPSVFPVSVLLVTIDLELEKSSTPGPVEYDMVVLCTIALTP